MPKSFVSADVRNRYGRFAGEPDALQLATCFHLDDADIEFLVTKATVANHLGLALQLGCVRFLGAFAPDLATVPASVVAYVAGQIGVDDVSVPAGYGRGGTNTRHRQLICRHDGYRDLHNPLVALDLARWLTERAWMADERPEVLFDLATARLRQQRVLLPGLTTLERLVTSALSRMETRLLRRLAAVPTAPERSQLEALLVPDPAGGTSTLDQLRRGPQRVSVNGLRDATQRLAVARHTASAAWSLDGLPAAKITRLAHSAGTLRAQDLRRMPSERRLGTLVAFAHTLRRSAQDDLIHLLVLYLRLVINRADNKDRRERLRSLRLLDAAARDLAAACRALLDDNVHDTAVRSAAFARVPAVRIEAAVVTVEALAHRTAAGALERLAGSYPTLRRWLPGVLAHLELDANEAGRPVLDAWEFLRAIEGRRGPDMRQAPVEVVRGAWRDLVWDEERRVSRTFYTWCVLDRLQDALRRRDVFVPGSLDWGDPRAQLLQGAAWIAARGHVCRSLELPDCAADALDRLRTALDEAYTEAERSLSDEDLAWITSHRGRDTVAIGRFEKLRQVAEPHGAARPGGRRLAPRRPVRAPAGGKCLDWLRRRHRPGAWSPPPCSPPGPVRRGRAACRRLQHWAGGSGRPHRTGARCRPVGVGTGSTTSGPRPLSRPTVGSWMCMPSCPWPGTGAAGTLPRPTACASWWPGAAPTRRPTAVTSAWAVVSPTTTSSVTSTLASTP